MIYTLACNVGLPKMHAPDVLHACRQKCMQSESPKHDACSPSKHMQQICIHCSVNEVHAA